MKSIKIILIISLLVLSAYLLATDVRNMTYQPLNKINLPKVDKTVLPNGITLYLCEDHDLPVIRVQGRIRIGGYTDPADKIGLANLAGEMITSGGAGSYSARDFDLLLDKNGIQFYSYMDILNGGFGMSFLPGDTQLSFSILKAALLTPRYEEERLQIAKQGANSSISRRNDEMDEITFREFPKLVYGSTSPFARTEEYATIANISREDLIQFHSKYFQPQNISISIIGDFKTKVMKNVITQLFSDWKRGNDSVPALPKVEISYKKSINLVQRPEANQSWILMGHMAEITRNSPDYCPMVIMNNVLGGDFNSRIFQKIRTQMGLAYAPAGFYAIAYDHPGLLYLMSQTKSEKTITAIRALKEVVSDMQTVPVTDQELNYARDYFLNSYVFNFDSKGEIVGRMMEYDIYGYPMNFLQTVQEGIMKVTKEDVQRVAKQYLHPNDLITLVVGNDAAFEEPLSNLGNVNIVDIKIPPLKKDSVSVSTQDIAAGKELFGKVLKKIGNVSKIRNFQSTGTVVQSTSMGEMKIDVVVTAQFPSQFRQSMKTPYGNMEMIVSGNQGLMKSPMGNGPMPEETVKQMLITSPESFLSVAKDKDKLVISLGAELSVEGKSLKVLQFKKDDLEFQWLIDPVTLIPLYVIAEEEGENGPVTVRTKFVENSTIDGILFPMKKETQDNKGQIIGTSEMTEIKTNLKLPEDFFSVK